VVVKEPVKYTLLLYSPNPDNPKEVKSPKNKSGLLLFVPDLYFVIVSPRGKI
jgi:hypothetical protein